MNRIIVHVTHDDKFIDMALREFEAVAPDIHRPIIIGKNRSLRYVKTKGIPFLRISQAKSLINSDECAAVIFHSLSDDFLPLLEGIPASKKVIWLGWGYDYYERLLSRAYQNGLLLPESKALMAQSFKSTYIYRSARCAKHLVKNMLGLAVKYQPKLLDRIDYFSPVIDTEYQIAVELNHWFKARYVHWNYATVEDDLSDNSAEPENIGNDILVGNSATAENNHLEVFNLLKSCANLESRKIVVPLSYGDPWYRQRIIEAGRAIFGDRFLPLTGFLPKDEYISVVNNCGHVFLNHLRQQALGNICIMMLKGAKIYMNPNSPLFGWLTSKGAFISSIDHMRLTPLTDEQRQSNIMVIKNNWAREVQREKTRNLINIALESDK